MMMNRRNFLGSLGAGGLALMLSPSETTAAEPYEGPLLVTINAIGGWDITNFCDPKGNWMNERYNTGDILTAGGIPFAPLDTNEAFFTRFHSDMLLINGIDMRTAGHAEGARHMWSGELNDNNTPSLAALFAAKHVQEADAPAPFVSYGGFSRTGDLVPLTRLGSPLTLASIGRHERERGIPTASRYVDDFVLEEVFAARAKRHEAAPADELPRLRAQRSLLYGHQLTTPLLRRYQEHLPEANHTLPVHQAQAAISLACLKAGVGASASLFVSDFDTHSNHEELHAIKLQELLEAITYTVERAAELDLLDRLTIVVSSEFSRTPEYNGNAGKDHWPCNSMIVMGPGITGNRVVGGTDDALMPKNVNLDTLALDDDGDRLYPGHVHTALREHLGLGEFGVETGFDLRMRTVPLFV